MEVIKTLEDTREGYRKLFFENPGHVEFLVMAGSISCLIEDIEATKEIGKEEVTETENLL